MKSILECIKQISSNEKIAIITHTNADADALCSSIFLKRAIKSKYETEDKHIHIDIFTETKTFGDLYEPIIRNVPINNQRFKKYDLAIAVDSPTLSRLGKYKRIFKRAKDTLLFDHHETCEFFARNNLMNTVSSTCELLYTIFAEKKGWKLSAESLRLIYTGIITDTNNLTQNISVSTHKIIANLMQMDTDKSLSLETIRNYFFKNSTKEKMSLLQRALESLSFYENDRIAMMKIVKQDLIDTGCSQDDTLGIVDYAINMKGVDIGIIFIKQEDNSYYVSLRSKNNIDVGLIAKALNGGGHLNTAAFQSAEPLTDIRSKLIAECKKQFAQMPTENDISHLFDEDV